MSLLEPLISGVTLRKRQLLDEFTHWRKRTGQGAMRGRGGAMRDGSAAPDLPEHHSQVERITRQLERLLEHIAIDPLDALAVDQRIDRAREARSAIHHVHLVWNFFRRKLALRDVPALRDMLICADDFAWACFEPALERGLTKNLLKPETQRAPPLVYLADEQGPLMRGRDSGFDIAEPRDLPTELVHRFREVGRHLPVPIIGMPWHEANRLPPLIHIAHEVGHVVADDLAWLPAIKQQITDSPGVAEDRRAGWLQWAEELAADAYAVACGGDAYIAMLSLELLEPQSAIRNDKLPDSRGRWGRYPTPWLRVHVANHLRQTLGHPDKGAWNGWIAACGESHGMAGWPDDVPAVAEIMGRGTHLHPLGIADLGELFGGPDSAAAAEAMATYLLSAVPGDLRDCRTLVVGAALAYIARPARFDSRITATLFRQYAKKRKASTRGPGDEKPGAAQIDAQVEADARTRDAALASLLGIPAAPAGGAGD